MTKPDLSSSQMGDLAKLMRLDSNLQENWSAEELREIFCHQLAAPLTFDLTVIDQNISDTIRSLYSTKANCPESFGDLFAHPSPSLELLNLTKQFAKKCGQESEIGLPKDVAAVLYLAAVSAALVHCGEQITETDRKSLKAKVDWALGREWLEQSIRILFEQTHDLLQSS